MDDINNRIKLEFLGLKDFQKQNKIYFHPPATLAALPLIAYEPGPEIREQIPVSLDPGIGCCLVLPGQNLL